MTSPFAAEAIAPETARFNRDLAAQLAELPRPMDVPVELTRKARAEGHGILPLGGPRPGSHWQEIPGGRVRVSLPERAPRGTYLHMHGGGWTFGAPEQSDADCQRIARTTGARVVSVSYRLAPEHRWPAQREDCLAAARWVLETLEEPVVIGGESAGAHLAAVVALALRDEGRMAGCIFNYGMFDLAGTPSVRAWGSTYLILSTPIIRWFVENLTGGEGLADPALSPLYADLSGMVPALFQCGTADPLLDDTLFMAARWEAAGNHVERRLAPGGVHAFDQFDLAIADAARARRDAFIAERLAA